ncbi:FAS1-like dehydratase domain-containing protein [Azospirillum sp. B510]|uniref:FAS1-like dehydratase domain-containing protein n=1 Tax=Azospirillum sp. (strain B510) TaxID=137722 RepID=UPI00130520C2|nr:MaoC family dehydratase N-terminal domain-containing protein [Azospirillum sp. B510]
MTTHPIEYPKTIEGWEGFSIEADSDLVVERGAIDHWLEAVRDANPIYWHDAVASEIAGGIVAPPPMALAFTTSYRWSPKHPAEIWDVHGVEAPETRAPLRLPLEVHFALKEFTGLKEGIAAGIESEFYEPLRLGDRLTVNARILSIGEERTNRLGTGRSWTVEVRYSNQRKQLVSIERYRFFSYNRM